MAKNVQGGLAHLKSSFSNHIHISGPARSGTTLVKNLFTCFKNTIVIPAETLPDLSWHYQGTDNEREDILADTESRIITKQPGNVYPYNMYPDLRQMIMFRDPRDLMASVNPSDTTRAWHSENTVNNVLNMFDAAVKEGLLIVYYEELVTSPDTVQKIIEKEFGLEPICCFSQWHKQPVNETTFYLKGMRGLRSISAEHVGQWKTSPYREDIDKWVNETEGVVDRLKAIGYEV